MRLLIQKPLQKFDLHAESNLLYGGGAARVGQRDDGAVVAAPDESTSNPNTGDRCAAGPLAQFRPYGVARLLVHI